MNNKIEGLGLGLRFPHFNDILQEHHQVPWFEVIAEDFLEPGPHHDKLEKLREKLPITLHSIGLNIGGVDPLNKSFMKELKNLYEKYEPSLISDHLCWSAHEGKYHHDLMPIPKTKDALSNCISRVQQVQDYMGRELVLENITSYIAFENEDYTEIEFLKLLAEKTDCYFLLDISNVLINGHNNDFSAADYFEQFPMQRVRQMHLAGGVKTEDGLIIDSHSSDVGEADTKIYLELLQKHGPIPAIIERDAEIPSFQELNEQRQLITRMCS